MAIDDFIDRRVPLAIILALSLQAGGVVWWAATKDTDDHFNQQRIDRLELAAVQSKEAQTEVLQRLARIEERVNAETSVLDRIEKHLGRR
jgi:LPS O-antigen subunit length determinant protein (WzzB/FepE family)